MGGQEQESQGADPRMMVEEECFPLHPDWAMLGDEGEPGQEMCHVGITDPWSEESGSHLTKSTLGRSSG